MSSAAADESPQFSCAQVERLNDTHNHLFDVFEGIPFNILFNTVGMTLCFIVYAILLLINSMLRSRGKYVFSMHRAGMKSPSIWKCLTMSKIDLMQHAGLDGAAYLHAIEKSALTLLSLSPFLAVVLPVYYSTGRSSSAFQRLTVSNIDSLSAPLAWYIWAVTSTCCGIYLGFTVYQLAFVQNWPRYQGVCRLWNNTVHSEEGISRRGWHIQSGECQCHLVNQVPNVLMLTGVPQASDKELNGIIREFFSSVFPPVSVQWIHPVRDQTVTMRLEKRRSELVRNITICEELTTNRYRPMYLRNLSCGLTWSCCWCCGDCSSSRDRKADALEYYSVQLALTERSLQDIYRQLESQKGTVENASISSSESVRLHFTGIVFVGLRTSREALQVAKQMSTCCRSKLPRCYIVHTEVLPGLHRAMQGREYPRIKAKRKPFSSIMLAPLSSDILWTDLMKYRRTLHWRKCWGIVVTSLVFFLALLATSPSYLLIVLDSLHGSGLYEGEIGFYVQRWIPALVLVIASYLVRQLVIISENWNSHKTYSAREKIGQRRLFAFLVLTVLIFPSAGVGGLPALVARFKSRSKSATAQFSLGCFFVPDSSVLFINYIVTSALIGGSVELLQLGRLVTFLIRSSCSVHSVAEAKILADEGAGPFPYRERYATLSLIQTIVLTYTPICPLILLFGFLYLACDYLFSKYVMLRIYDPYGHPEVIGQSTTESRDVEKRTYHITWTIQSILSTLSGICLSCFLLLCFFSTRLLVFALPPGVVVAFLILFLVVLVAVILISLISSKRWFRLNNFCAPIPTEDFTPTIDLEEATAELRAAEYSRF